MNSRRDHYLNLTNANKKTPAGLQPAEVVNRNTNQQESETVMSIITHSKDATKAPNPWGVLLEVGDELILRDGRTVKPGDPVWLAQIVDDGDPWRTGVYFFLKAGIDNHPVYTTKPGEIYSYDLDGEHFAYRFITAATFSHCVILDGDQWSVLRRASDAVQEVPC